jgi:DNA-binding transcriptional LysR family regulator
MPLVELVYDLEREVSLLDATRGGQLTIGAGPYASELIVKPVLKTLLSGRPEFRIRVGIDHWLNLVQRLRSEEFSLVIAELSEINDEPDLEIRPLNMHQGYFLVRAGPPAAEKAGNDRSRRAAVSACHGLQNSGPGDGALFK